MDDFALQQLDFSYYNTLFTRMIGTGFYLAVCSGAGEPIWTAEEIVDKGILSEACQRFSTASDNSAQSILLSDNRTVFILRLFHSATETSLGCLLAIPVSVDKEEIHTNETMTGEALATLAAGMLRECDMARDLNVLSRELSERYEELHFVYSLSGLNRDYTRAKGLFKNLTKLCVEFLHVKLAAYIRPDSQHTAYSTDGSAPISNLDLLVVRLRRELYRFVASAKETTIINDPRDARRAYLCENMPFKILAAPIINNNRVTAIIVMLRELTGNDFSNSDRKLTAVLADQVSTLIQNQDLYSNLQDFTAQMAGALIEAVDAKDPYTRGHSDRVHFFATQIGNAMQLSKTELDTLYWSSLLHDIGKIGIPDVVLSKPGRLDQDEFIIIKTHPERGYDILKNVIQLNGALPGIRHHHERFDGSGYPFGLQGKSIPLNARIVAVADTYDAMTSSRSYRPARQHEEAMTEIVKMAGSQFDKEVVDIWCAITNEQPEIIKSHRASAFTDQDDD